MDDASPRHAVTSLRQHGRLIIALILISMTARFAWFAVRPSVAVSRDVHNWQTALDCLATGGNPYAQTDVLNWPPMWMVVLYAIGRVIHVTGLSLQALLFPGLIVADQIEILALILLLRELCPQRPFFWTICLGLALNPAMILLSAQHGNFDVLIAICLTMGCLCLCRFCRRNDPIDWLWSCAFVGLGMFCKTPAMVVLPVLMVAIGRLPFATLLLGALLAALPALVGDATIYVLAPARVWQYVIIYRSIPGFYGVSGLLMMCGPKFAAWYVRIFPFALLIFLAWLCRFVARRRGGTPTELVLLAALLTLIVPAVGSGFGAQYIYWTAPLLVASYVSILDRRWRAGLIVLTAIVALTYSFQYLTVWSLGAAALQGRMLSISQQKLFDFISSPAGLTIVRLPMFIGTLFVTAYGVRLLYTRRFAEVSA